MNIDYTKLVHELFEQHVAKHPDDIAIIEGDRSYSFDELNKRANRISNYLLAQNNNAKITIGICLPRSFDLIASIFAVLKAGGAYVPLDSNYPSSRLATMIAQLPDIDGVITLTKLKRLLGSRESKAIYLDEFDDNLEHHGNIENPIVSIDPLDPCYVVFTSGSTGVPKATVVTHAGWSNLNQWIAQSMGFTAKDTNLLMSPFGFDITQRSIASSLIAGVTVSLLPNGPFDPFSCAKQIVDENISIFHCAPSVLYCLIDSVADENYKNLTSIRLAFIGGEALSGPRVKSWVKSKSFTGMIINVYGVAECADVSSSYSISSSDDIYLNNDVPIGVSIPNNSVVLVNKDDAVIPYEGKESSVGELFILGIGVGLGYANNHLATAEKFVVIPALNKQLPIYKTGDLGKYLDDGNLQYLGRSDSQVKIRGIRVELGEIEACIRQLKISRDVAVSFQPTDNGGCLLAVFLVDKPSTGLLHHSEDADNKRAGSRFRRSIAQSLPAHMIPDQIHEVSEFPLNVNGKLDRKVLFSNFDLN